MAKIKIRTQFLSLFMIVGIIPLFVIGGLFFIQSTCIILNKSYDQMNTLQRMRITELEENFESITKEFDTLESSQIVKEIINSNYANNDKYNNFFTSYLSSKSFYNIYFLSRKNGDVLYSFKDEPMLSKSSGLSRVWGRAIMSTEAEVEDFSAYAPSNDMQSLFVGKSYKNNAGEIEGVFVLQIGPDFIDETFKSREGLGNNGESYLLNYTFETDRYGFRSNMQTMGNGQYTVGYYWTLEPLDYWKDAVNIGSIGGQGLYHDSHGRRVLVKYNRIDISGLNWYLISKVDRSEILSSLNSLLVRIIIISLILMIFVALISIHFSSKVATPIIKGVDFAESIAKGEYDKDLDIHRKDEIGVLAKALKNMGRSLKEQAWIRLGKEGLDNTLRGEHDIQVMGTKYIAFMCKHLDAQVGALYLKKDDKSLYLSSSYAFSDRQGNYNKIGIGEGMVGQSAFEKEEIVYTHIPSDAPGFNFGISSVIPTCYVATPLVFEDKLIGVSLIGITVPATKLQRRFISEIKDSVAILLNSASSSTVIQKLLEDSQTKQEQLRVSNEELEQQTEALKDSEKDMQTQQEELRVTNEELEERTDALEKQRQIMNEKNNELEIITKDLEKKADDLERASQYKSEFLANMSHELRTPLNSILILSQLIANNKKGNLDEKQIKSAEAINSSGEDLLKLINEILDLSKVEAGKIEIHLETMTIDSLIEDMDRVYRPSADQKGVKLLFSKDENLPQSIITDSHRLQQVLKNLLTNAFKFTEKAGTVSLNITKNLENIIFSVKDSGIGIPKDKQNDVFEAFKQADGSTSRKYGGTGLGLSISKELMKLLGGTITLNSEEGLGSTFSISIPIKEGHTVPLKSEKKIIDITQVKDDRGIVTHDNKTLLIIEDDVNFATVLKEQAHNRGFKVLIAEDGETGLHFSDYYRPSAIILDIGLPGIDGWQVMDRLKSDSELKDIPVYFISGAEEKLSAIEMGAVGFMMKPISLDSIKDAFEILEESISSKLHNLLIVEDDKLQRESIGELICGDDINIKGVGSGAAAFAALKKRSYDCVILDLGLEDISGYDLLDQMKADDEISKTPVIIYTGRDLSSEEELKLNKYAESIIIKGVKSPERLLEETSLFLNRGNNHLPENQELIPNKVTRREEVLGGKNILVVDDDIRNIFALSNILEEKDINIIVAKDGIESIEKIKEHPEIDLVLMDIMMPRMDGYEAIAQIRTIKDRGKLPIIALTANAMKGDRNKCIDAGANDYLAKPVDNNKLISMLRVWLY